MSLRLRPPPPTPFPEVNAWLLELYIELQRIDTESRKLQRDVEIAVTNRLILHDPTGLRYVVDVNATGPAVRATAL